MKTPNPRKLKSGSYFIQLRLGGESISITRDTAKECTRAAMAAKAAYLAAALPKKRRSDRTVGSVVDDYIKSRPAKTSPSTLRGYEQIRKHRFSEAMSKKPAQVDWQKAIDAESELCAPKTLQNAWGMVKSALTDAGYSVPKVVLPQEIKNNIPFLRYDEIIPLLNAVKGSSSELAIILGLHSLRRSELLAVGTDDVDRKNKRIIVKGASVRGSDGLVDKDTNKNVSSQRAVPIMIPRFWELVENVSDGKLITVGAEWVVKYLHATCLRIGVTDVTLHGLRHSFVSLCYHNKVGEEQCMKWGGWSDYREMHRRYMHIAELDESEDLKKMRDFFEEKK